MKIQTKYIFILILLTGGFILNSCESLLDKQVPVSVLTEENAYETQADLEAGLQGVYNRLLFALGEANGNFYNTGLLSDETACRMSQWGDLRGGPTYWGDFGIFRADEDIFSSTMAVTNRFADWQVFYVPANMINTLLEVSEGIDFASAGARTTFEGELYFLRAFCYFNLLRIWGKVPIIDFAYTSAEQDFYPKQSEKSVVATFIAGDIDLALSKLPSDRNLVVRATIGAVNALKAHLYAWKGRVLDGGNADMQTAAEAAQEVINEGYQLLPDYTDIFYSGYQSAESIFEFLTKPGVLTSNLGMLAKEPHIAACPRGAVEFAEEHLVYFENTPEDTRIDVLKNESQEGDLIQAPYVSKWLGSSGSIPSDEADNIIVFRLADIILLRAEMLNQLGQLADAITLLNQIRTRAGLPNTTAATQAEVAEAIFEERRLELMAEGHLWFDIVRNGKALDIPGVNNNPDRIYFPVYQAEMDANDQLEQNPGYN